MHSSSEVFGLSCANLSYLGVGGDLRYLKAQSMRAKVDLLHPFATMDRLDGLLSKLREIDLSGTIVDVKASPKGDSEHPAMSS